MSSKVLLFTVLFGFALGFPVVSGQGLSGRITNESGEAIAFATVYVSALHQGTTANMEGEYHLPLPPGEHEVRFQYLGYQTQTQRVRLGASFLNLDVVMQPQQYVLPEVIVTASGEDPAYYIMRRAIGMSQYYLNQVSEYNARVYLKGSGVLTRIPALMRRQLEREGIEQDKYFVTETLSEIAYTMPDQMRTRVISTRSSGDDNSTSPMSFVTISLYRDINGIISPLSRNAFQVYRFRLEGTFIENGHQINKIRVIPRRAGPDLYSGHLYIREGTWSLHTVDLRIEQNLFSANIRQVYNPVAEGVWMPVSHDFFFQVSAMGFEMDYTYVVSVSDYHVTLNPELDHTFYALLGEQGSDLFLLEQRNARLQQSGAEAQQLAQPRAAAGSVTPRQQEIAALMSQQDLGNRQMRRLNRLVRREARANQPRPSLEVTGFSMEIDDSASLRTAAYWMQHRPVPLTQQELESFSEQPADTTAAEPAKQRSTFGKVVRGNTYTFNEGLTLRHNGLISPALLSYNTVDGLLYGQRFTLQHRMPAEKRMFLRLNTAWAFARQEFTATLAGHYHYDPFRRATIGFEGGRDTRDFNAEGGMLPFINTISTLFLTRNDRKLFEQDFLRLWHTTDVVNGLVLETSVEMARRRPLENNADFAISKWGNNSFTPNIPDIKGLENDLMPIHNAFIADVRLSYTHRHYFMRVGQRKQMLSSRWPTLSLFYRQGFDNVLGSDTRFQLLESSIRQQFSLKMVGEFSYLLQGGKFLNNDQLFTPDFRHFNGNTTWVMPAGSIHVFRNLGFYQNSTSDKYALGHLQYEHGRILIKRLPFMARTLAREKIFMNMLATPEHKPYWEAGYGINQLFLLFNLEVVTGFRGNKHEFTGFRIGIPMGGEASIRM